MGDVAYKFEFYILVIMNHRTGFKFKCVSVVSKGLQICHSAYLHYASSLSSEANVK
jgi:hypothetical protein